MSAVLKTRRRMNFIPLELQPSALGPATLATVVVVMALALPAAGLGAATLRWSAERKLQKITVAREQVAAQLTSSIQTRDSSADQLAAAAIKKAMAEKLYWAEAFKELSNLAPKSIWLTAFDTAVDADGKKVSIAGQGSSQLEISEFFARLEQSYFFRDVQIKFSENSEEKGAALYRFKFEGKVFDEPKGGRNGST